MRPARHAPEPAPRGGSAGATPRESRSRSRGWAGLRRLRTRTASCAGPLAPALLLLQDLGALELLARVGISRVAGTAHGLPRGDLELEETEVSAVRLVDGLGVEVRLALDEVVPAGAGSAQHLLDLCRRHGAAVAVVLLAGVPRVAGVARITGVVGVIAVALGGGSRLRLLRAQEDDLLLRLGNDLLRLLGLRDLLAVDGRDGV